MARSMYPPAGLNYYDKVGRVVYKTSANIVTLATNITTHKPAGVILSAKNATNGELSIAEPGDDCFAAIDSTATIIATTTHVCLGANSGVVEETSASRIVGFVTEANPASPQRPGYLKIKFQPELNVAP